MSDTKQTPDLGPVPKVQPPKYVAERASPAEAPVLAERLWSTGGMSDASIPAVAKRRSAWLYHDNPMAPASTWVVRHGDQIVGCASLTPRIAYVAGRRVRAGMLIDFVLVPKHRFAGPAVTLQRRLLEDTRSEFELVFAYPNEMASPIFRRLRYETVDTATEYLRPLRSRQDVESLLSRSPYGQRIPKSLAPFASRGAALGVDIGLRALDQAFALGSRGHAEVLSSPDERFDELARTVIRGDGVWLLRDRAYLDWRYAKHPTRSYRIFASSHSGAARESGALRGYIVYSIRNNVANVEDACWRGGSWEATALFAQYLLALRKEGVRASSIVYAGLTPCRFERLGFIRRTSTRPLIVRAEEATAHRRDSWSIAEGEIDI